MYMYCMSLYMYMPHDWYYSKDRIVILPFGDWKHELMFMIIELH